MEKRLVFSFETVGDEKLVKRLAELRLALRQITKDMETANKAPDKKAFNDLSVVQDKLKKAIQETSKQIKEQNQAFENSKYPTDSLRALQTEYSRLATSIRNMSKAQRESFEGQGIINKAKQLKDLINEQSMAFGDNTKNIGNYTQSIQRALENPIKFLKNAGLVGIIATIGVKLYGMGKAATEAFAKTEEGAKKLKGVQLAFERVKAVALDFAYKAIEAILPFIEKIMPFIIKGLIIMTAHFSGIGALVKQLGSNIVSSFKSIGNSIEIAGLKAKNFIGLGSEEDKQRVKDLQAENVKLADGIVNVGVAYKKAFDAQVESGTKAAATAKLQAEKQKEQKTILEGLKKQEESLTKTIEDRIVRHQDVTKELEKLRGIQEQILAIEIQRDKILAQSNVTKLTNQRNALTKTLSGLTQGTKEYTAAAEKLLAVEALLKEAEANLDPARAKREAGLKELKDVLDEAAKAIQDSGGIEFEGKLFDKATKEYEKFIEAQKKKDADLAALKKKNQENINTDFIKGEQDKADQEETEAKAAAAKKKDIAGQLAQAAKETALEAVNFGAQLLNQGLEEERTNLNKQTDYKLQALNDEYDKKKAFASGNNELLVRLEGERAKKEEKIKKDAAKKDREIAIKQALIQGAVAIVRTLGNLGFPAGLIASIPIAAATAFQIALIKSQKFDKGGYAMPAKAFKVSLDNYMAGKPSPVNLFTIGGHTGAGAGRDETGERVAGVGVYHGGEYIAPRKQVQRYPGLFRSLDRERGGARLPDALNVLTGTRLKRMAQGGFTIPPRGAGLSQAMALKDVNATFNDDQILYLAKTIAMQTARETASELGRSLDNVNRRKERDERLKSKLSA